MDTPVEVGPRDDGPFSVTEIRGHLADLRQANAHNEAVQDVINIVEAMLVHHDCDRSDATDTGALAQVIPLPSPRG
ncbi:hypothetical protein ACFXGA_18755 [Actinosynnema sp. NPDC059335]|uniref:hypothetical protein n=1 Tax=Actinosynnema sp. NPDC059335 TaxID=3346804 RepID=UPI00366E2F69